MYMVYLKFLDLESTRHDTLPLTKYGGLRTQGLGGRAELLKWPATRPGEKLLKSAKVRSFSYV